MPQPAARTCSDRIFRSLWHAATAAALFAVTTCATARTTRIDAAELTVGAQPSDIEMVRWGESLGREVIVAATKLDRIARNRRAQQIDRIAGQLAVPKLIGFSAKELFGVDELWRELLTA